MSYNTLTITPTRIGVRTDTESVMLAIVAEHLFHYKTLLVDVSTDGRATNMISKTYGVTSYKNNIGDLVRGTAASEVSATVTPFLDIVAGYPGDLDVDFQNEELEGYKDFSALRVMLKPIYNDYDFVIVVPPDNQGFALTNCIMAVKNVVITIDAKPSGITLASEFITNYLQRIYDSFENVDFDIVGILPVDFEMTGAYKGNYKKIIEAFGHGNVYYELVKRHARLKQFVNNGATLYGYYDKRMFALFADILLETIERVNCVNQNGDVDQFEYQASWYDFINDRLLPTGGRIQNYDFIEQKPKEERHYHASYL